MKKHNDDWEEFLKQRESEKLIEEAELNEIIEQDYNSNTNKNLDLEKQAQANEDEQINLTNTQKQELENLSDKQKKLAKIMETAKQELDENENSKIFDVNSLSEEEILGGITSLDVADQLYDEASKLYDEAFDNWELDPDNEELQQKLDDADRNHDIAMKRVDILQNKEIENLKNRTKQILDSTHTTSSNKPISYSRTFAFVITFIVLSSFFGTIFLSINGYGKFAFALLPCTMILLVFGSIFKFFIAPQIKINAKNNKKAIILSILLLIVLAACLFIAIFGSCLKNMPMIIGGIVGFVGIILLGGIISKIKK